MSLHLLEFPRFGALVHNSFSGSQWWTRKGVHLSPQRRLAAHLRLLHALNAPRPTLHPYPHLHSSHHRLQRQTQACRLTTTPFLPMFAANWGRLSFLRCNTPFELTTLSNTPFELTTLKKRSRLGVHGGGYWVLNAVVSVMRARRR